jgi:hypothetical protein
MRLALVLVVALIAIQGVSATCSINSVCDSDIKKDVSELPFSIEFVSHVFHQESNMTTFTYNVTTYNHQVNHWVIGRENCESGDSLGMLCYQFLRLSLRLSVDAIDAMALTMGTIFLPGSLIHSAHHSIPIRSVSILFVCTSFTHCLLHSLFR